MAKFHKLRASKGTDEVNVGTERFPVDDNGEVEVPAHAVDALKAVGGFSEDDQSDPIPDGTVAMRHVGDATGCSWGGESYEPDADGVFTVPAAASADLSAHGFVVAEVVEKKTTKIPQLKI